MPTLQESVEAYRKAYGHYPKRVLADTIFRTRDNRRYCKEHGIHLNGPRLGKPAKNSSIRKRELHLEWLESGEREILNGISALASGAIPWDELPRSSSIPVKS